MEKIEKVITVNCKQGLHARPAALFVQIAEKFDSTVTIRKDGEDVNGKSIMGILMLGAHEGSSVTLIIEGADASETMKELEAFLQNNE